MTDLLPIVVLSLKTALAATLLILPPGVWLGWLLARRNFPGKTLLEGLVNIPLVLPPVVTGYALLFALSPASPAGRFLENHLGLQIAFAWPGAVLAAAVVSFPLLVRAVRVAVSSVSPGLEEAASVLNAPAWAVWLQITLPLSAHGILGGMLLAFARALGEFGATIVLASNIPARTQTIPLAIFTFLNQPGGEAHIWPLVLFSLILAYASLLLNEVLIRRIHHA